MAGALLTESVFVFATSFGVSVDTALAVDFLGSEPTLPGTMLDFTATAGGWYACIAMLADAVRVPDAPRFLGS